MLIAPMPIGDYIKSRKANMPKRFDWWFRMSFIRLDVLPTFTIILLKRVIVELNNLLKDIEYGRAWRTQSK